MKYICYDPGADGAVVCLNEDGTIDKYKMPKIGNEVDLGALFDIVAPYAVPGNMFGIEDVKQFPGIAANAMAKLLWIKGVMQGILTALKVPYEMVPPKTWQKTCHQNVPLIKKANGKNDTKAMSLLAAKRLNPTEDFLGTERSKVPHDGIVDAYLMCVYLKTKYGK